LRNTEAYTVYLKGLHTFNQFDQQGFDQAILDFQRALDLDPLFAEARVWLAITYLNVGAFGFMPAAAADELVRHSAELALKLDPNLATAHTLLGLVDIRGGNWAAVDRELKLARALAPGDYGVVVLAEQQATARGRWDDVLKQANARLELDPLSPLGYSALRSVQLRRGRLAEAEAAARRTLEVSPTFSFAHYSLGIVLLARGEPDAALKEFLKEPIEGARLQGSAMAYFALGRHRDSDTVFAGWLELFYPVRRRYPFALAETYAFRKQSDEALKSLEDAYDQRDTGLPNPNAYPLLDSLHGDPRYQALLKKMNLPE
jgi:tetratricopeptide (TPR) repeat protein